jgi:hypothetical protein
LSCAEFGSLLLPARGLFDEFVPCSIPKAICGAVARLLHQMVERLRGISLLTDSFEPRAVARLISSRLKS